MSPAVLCSKEMDPSLVTLFNLSMEQSKVPTSCKLVNVIPAHRVAVSNYRSISLLNIVSKVMEKPCYYNYQ